MARIRTPSAQHTTSVDEARWSAVISRDKSADGTFYYAVATTGVYCRPSCAARLAKRSNVTFHATPDDAERAGFRPCKRCKPRAPGLAHRDSAIVTAACRAIETAEATPTLAELARASGLSAFHFHRLFKAATGVTPRAYAAAHRQKRVEANLTRSSTVTEAIFNSGFNSSGRFYASAKDTLGMSPSAYRSGGLDTEMKFAVGRCSLGSILVAATAKGVCAILMGDDPDALIHDLERRFPNARLLGADRDFKRLVAAVIDHVETPQTSLDLPLDLRGTAFQHRVWQALRAIPAGTTSTYADVAKRIGQPKAVRAVARACAANPVALAVPCHRVIRNDGSLSGYRWGVERKRALLAREAKPAKGETKPAKKKA